MLPYLNNDSPFPGVDQALEEPNGLLAAGADLSPQRLLYAYRHGIFPWYSPGEPILWWSPDPRAVFFVEHFKVHKSVPKTLRNLSLEVTLNRDFDTVIQACAAPRGDDSGTWLSKEMIQAYNQLHQQGHAHSVEVWQDGILVGGIYGVAVGSVFCGESMFSRVSNGSKIALSCLALYLAGHDFRLIDCQIDNPHLTKLGSSLISRELYLSQIKAPPSRQHNKQMWAARKLDWRALLGGK